MILYKNLPEPRTALTRYSDTEFVCLQELPRTCSVYSFTELPLHAKPVPSTAG